MAWLAAAGAVLQGGAAGATMWRGADKSAIKGTEQARQMLVDAPLADESKLRYQVELLREMGQLTPEMEQEILQDPSLMQQVTTDPRLKEAQMEALTRMERQGREGLTLEERAADEDIRRGLQQESRADQEAILQNMQARGQLGSGAELAARMQASQSAADTARQQGTELARLMAARKMEAAMNAGQMGGQMREQEFGESSKKAQAQDLINQFNTQSRQGTQQRNVGSKNQAQQYNLDYDKQREAQRAEAVERQNKINKEAYEEAINQRLQRAKDVGGLSQQIGGLKDKNFAGRVGAASKMGQGMSSFGTSGMMGGGGGASGGAGA